jgi:drug/metabolite transporter (DMT)-like permease
VRLVQGSALSGIHNLRAAGLFYAFLVLLFVPLAQSRQHNMEGMPEMNALTAPEHPAAAAKRLADKQESEFNHHLAGFFVIFAGVFILAESTLAKRWPLVCYVWPTCFLAAGFFLLVFSDTEMWPFGPQTPWYAITHEAEDLQHKIFSIILLSIGYVELQRARGQWRVPWATWLFPVLGVAGAILLLFHVHSGNMQAPHAMETMERIRKQHRWFAATGLGIALVNGLAGIPLKWQQIFKKAWPALLIVLGVLLVQYTE